MKTRGLTCAIVCRSRRVLLVSVLFFGAILEGCSSDNDVNASSSGGSPSAGAPAGSTPGGAGGQGGAALSDIDASASSSGGASAPAGSIQGGTGSQGGTSATTAPLGVGCASGTIVEHRDGCWVDDSFCDQMADGRYCTGYKPFICPAGQVRTSWISCGFPSGGSTSTDTMPTGGSSQVDTSLGGSSATP